MGEKQARENLLKYRKTENPHGWSQKDRAIATVTSRGFYLVLRVGFISSWKQLSDKLVPVLFLIRS
jgi:hypothetical protein